MPKKKQLYSRLGVFRPEEILPHVIKLEEAQEYQRQTGFWPKKYSAFAKGREREFLGHMVHMLSDRYMLFASKGMTCAGCGITGTFFALEIPSGMTRPHFNLYGFNSKGEEVMITKDHIIPSSKGGLDRQENYMVLCWNCNFAKGNKIEEKKEVEK